MKPITNVCPSQSKRNLSHQMNCLSLQRTIQRRIQAHAHESVKQRNFQENYLIKMEMVPFSSIMIYKKTEIIILLTCSNLQVVVVMIHLLILIKKLTMKISLGILITIISIINQLQLSTLIRGQNAQLCPWIQHMYLILKVTTQKRIM